MAMAERGYVHISFLLVLVFTKLARFAYDSHVECMGLCITTTFGPWWRGSAPTGDGPLSSVGLVSVFLDDLTILLSAV